MTDADVMPTRSSKRMGSLLIDLDGVLRRWPHIATGLPEGALEAVATVPGLVDRVLTGAMTDVEWREAIVSRLSTEYGMAHARRAVGAWSGVGVLDPAVLDLVRRVRTRGAVWLATNATSRLPTDLVALGLDRELDGVVNSSDVGSAKPAAAFFRAAIALAGPVALFVDDSPGHCEAARSIGLVAHRFETVNGLETALGQVGLLS